MTEWDGEKMNDQDYIRKAVELADGWAQSKIGKSLVRLDGDEHVETLWKGEQYTLDALAAQLVRQVDATADYSVHTMPGKAWITRCGSHRDEIVSFCSGPFVEHAMNTIKAIVDSGVLS